MNRGGPVLVSVVVPVFNAGPYIETCVRSILNQSLPHGKVEAILVDDGSTDDTPARIDALAAGNPTIRVIHQEPSGWPGKPRNVGMAAARGRYLFFLDNDDTLGREALDRMCAMATRNASDIVVGKMAGFHRPVPKDLFFANRERATLADAPLIEALTPHKLFRRAFVEEHRLRFPEGRRRLEDHVFVLAAYFAAGSISVLSDYVCYYHIRRDDRSNAGGRALEPAGYYGNLREVLGIVQEHTQPGHLRDRLLERFARVELLGRLRGRAFLDHTDAHRNDLFEAIRSVVADHIPVSVDALLAPHQRVQMALLRARRLDLLIDFAEADVLLTARARVARVTRSGSAFRIEFEAWLMRGPAPLALDDGTGVPLLPVPGAVAAAVPADARTLAGPAQPTARLVLRKRDDWAELVAPTHLRPPAGDARGSDGLTLHAEATVDPVVLSVGLPVWPGRWDVIARVEAFGSTRDTHLGSVGTSDLLPSPGSIDLGGRTIRRIAPYWTGPTGKLAFKVTDVRVRPLYRRLLSRIRRAISRPTAPGSRP